MISTILHYLPYVLLFAAATAFLYGWGLWRASRQQQDLANLLASKGVAKVKKTLKKNGPMTSRELEAAVKDLTAKQPFCRERIGVTDPEKFLGSILPYMVKQRMIIEEKKERKIVYRIRSTR
ncbi:MAG TPA: hypothetical protein IAA21_02000 [Candidatus Blautia faecigallinarum]|uniref:Uncharacterized protein n=1 Tax=Candidatus Blautia faecigallinarum TaxID=2838488 RepID=A0A9D2DR54_9FIRM|nr:hypothetical protein [Candidatus Blautia faecigallinarum]